MFIILLKKVFFLFKKGYVEIRRILAESMGVKKYSRLALNNLDTKLEKYLDFENGFFIEAGANDGVTQSNTYYLEKINHWKGVLIEGIPEKYQACKRARKQSLVYNCALVEPSFPNNYIEMHYANLMSAVSDSMKAPHLLKKHIETGLSVQNIKTSYRVLVPARTLESVLDEIKDLPNIDFFSLDVEGYELQVLKGLNIEKYRPTYILVESRFYDEVYDLLKEKYELIEKLSEHDYLFRIQSWVKVENTVS